jgi:hypothetical protein
MAMTPQETHEAFMAYAEGRSEAGFHRMCEELRSGELVLEMREDGYIIRAATAAAGKGNHGATEQGTGGDGDHDRPG